MLRPCVEIGEAGARPSALLPGSSPARGRPEGAGAPGEPTSGSTPTRQSDQFRPSVAADAAGNFVGGVGFQALQRAPTLRPAVRRGRYADRARVPGELLHDVQHGAAVRGPRCGGPDGRGLGRRGKRPGRPRFDVWAEALRRGGVCLPGPEFLVNAFTASQERRPSVAMSASGEFVVVWESNQAGEDSYGVFGRRFDADGTALGADFHANMHTTYAQYEAAVAMGPNGDFVIVWNSYWQDGQNGGVFGRRYDASGAPQGPEFAVNTPPPWIDNSFPRGRALQPGTSWSSGRTLSRCATQLRCPRTAIRRGREAPKGGEFPVNQFTTGNQGPAHVAMDGAGNFVVTWESLYQDGDSQGIFGRAFSRTRRRPRRRVRRECRHRRLPDPEFRRRRRRQEDFVVAWADATAHDGDGGGIFAPPVRDPISSSRTTSSRVGSPPGERRPDRWGRPRGFRRGGAETDGQWAARNGRRHDGHLRGRRLARSTSIAIARGSTSTRTATTPGEALGHRRARLFIVFQEAPDAAAGHDRAATRPRRL